LDGKERDIEAEREKGGFTGTGVAAIHYPY
jgi:hypothetical protein